jgi:hypothetical protein
MQINLFKLFLNASKVDSQTSKTAHLNERQHAAEPVSLKAGVSFMYETHAIRKI